MKELILSKESSESEIKRYFNAVLELSQSDNEYPINLDEVWMLVYENRNKAVEFLKNNFIQDVDFQTKARKVQASNVAGFVLAKDYFLTVSCMEFFIARKVRPVFEVYRQVFHKTAECAEKFAKENVRDKIAVAEWLAGFLHLNECSKLTLAKTIAEPLGLPVPDYAPSKGVLRPAGDLLKKHGCKISAQVFNKLMMKCGYMVERTRNSSNGRTKKFKTITRKGLEYGENQVCPNNPRSTQPLYFEDKFGELLVCIGVA